MTISKRYLNSIAYILIALAIISSLYLAVERIAIEKDYDQVEIMVNHTELISLARANSLEIEELATQLQKKGLTGILVKETSIGDLERTGQARIHQGQEILRTPYGGQINNEVPLLDSNIIITLHNKEIEEQVVQHIERKEKDARYYPGEVSTIVIPVSIPNSDAERARIEKAIKDLGVGFDVVGLETLANLGLSITPQIRDWENPSDQSLIFMAEQVKGLPNLSAIMFNDEKVPGFPEKFRVLANSFIDQTGEIYAPIGIVEFFDQRGINQMSNYLNKEAVRIHSISINEMSRYTPKSAIDRFELAVTERNIRSLFVRFLEMEQPAGALETNLTYFENLKDRIEGAGFTISGKVEQFNSPTHSTLIILLIGLGVIGGAVLLINTKDWPYLALIKLTGATLGWFALMYLSPILARKLMALASVIVFPTLAILMVMREKSRDILQSIIAFIKMSAISLIGALLMIGLLADKLFMLKLDQFAGVKIAHAIPVILVLALMHKFKDHPIKEARTILVQPITYLVAGLGGAIALGLAFYILRTGNVDADMVLGIEQRMRDALNQILGVRPRTKEFLIGYPVTLLLLYLGVSKMNWFLLIPAVIGQVSLVNTYAHIHTPIVISLTRSFHGIWIGIIFGVLLILAWRVIEKVCNKYVA